MSSPAPKDEEALARASARNWERYWQALAQRRRPPPRQSFWNGLKRFFKRSGGGELVYRIISREAGHPRGKLMLEAGCGSADVSLRLAQGGNKIVLLDTSGSALADAQRRARELGISAFPVRGSIFDLPFKGEIFDCAFNAGVVDHFGPVYRDRALREMLRVTRKQARIIVLTNDARSLIHCAAMKYAKKKGTWPFGFKDALYSLKKSLSHQLEPGNVREYSRGFISQFEFLHYYLPQNSLCQNIFFRIFYLFSFLLNFLNRLPGHYLVTVVDKRQEVSFSDE